MNSLTRHLMFDALWRSRKAWLWVGACVVIAWTLVAVALVSAKAGVAASLIGVFVLGPMVSMTSMVGREARYFPVTSRDVWLVTWLLSTLVATVYVTALQVAGMAIGLAAGFSQPVEWTSLILVALCAFAYGGTLLPVGPLIGYTTHAASERRPTWFWAGLAALMFLVYSGGLVLPWAAWAVLPSSFSELTWLSGAALMIGIGTAFGAVNWTPQRFGGLARLGERATPQTRRTPGKRATVKQGTGARDRLTGVARLLVPTLLGVFVVAVAAVAGFALCVQVFMATPSLYQTFASFGLLPFSAAGFSPKAIVGTAMFAPFFALAAGWVWDEHTRHLRVLPLSAVAVTRLMLASTLLAWAVLWVVLLGVHVVVLGFGPSTLRPELFLYLSGMTALLEAAWRGRKKPGQGFTLAMAPVFLLVIGMDSSAGRFGVEVMFWMHAVVGTGALLGAAMLTHRSLTRSTSSASVYKSSIPSFGG